MKTVFADAFYFVALVNRADQHHGKVVAASILAFAPWWAHPLSPASYERETRRLPSC
jgi:hypothetical protein